MEATATLALRNLTFAEGILYALLGMSVVFFALIALMVAIKVLVKFSDRNKAVATTETAAPVESTKSISRPAPGTAGELKLYNTDPRDAAMVMAIVADTIGKPLNELRFISIKEVEG